MKPLFSLSILKLSTTSYTSILASYVISRSIYASLKNHLKFALIVIGIAKGNPGWACTCPTYINCLPKCLICLVNRIKDGHTLIKQLNTLLKQSPSQSCPPN